MKKGIIAWIKSMSNGIHFDVVLKPGQLTELQRKECFGACTNCSFQNGLKLTLRSTNPVDPSLKARTLCGLNDEWVTPIREQPSSETCSRRLHAANKQMARVMSRVMKPEAVEEMGK